MTSMPSIGLQLLAVYLPRLAHVLDTYPLRSGDWGLILAGSVAPLVAGQIWKAARSRLIEENRST